MIRVLDTADVDALLTVEGVVDDMTDLFRLSAEPSSVGIDRVDLHHPRGWLRTLPGFIEPLGVFGFKTLNRTDGVGMRYAIYVHDLNDGDLIGVVDGLEVTNLRTGSVSAVGTRHLAVDDAPVAALIGTGPVARGQAVAIQAVRPARQIRVFARTPENRAAFVDEMSDELDAEVVAAGSLEEAIEGADVVTLATKATEPILRREHLRPGMHVNSVGPASRDRIEVDPAAFDAFDLIACDSVPLVLDEAGDAHAAVSTGVIGPAVPIELSSLVAGSAPGRTDPDQITLFKSVGNGLQDLIVAARLLDAAARQGMGTVVDQFAAVKRFGRTQASA